jgi:hypothetical protein
MSFDRSQMGPSPYVPGISTIPGLAMNYITNSLAACIDVTGGSSNALGLATSVVITGSGTGGWTFDMTAGLGLQISGAVGARVLSGSTLQVNSGGFLTLAAGSTTTLTAASIVTGSAFVALTLESGSVLTFASGSSITGTTEATVTLAASSTLTGTVTALAGSYTMSGAFTRTGNMSLSGAGATTQYRHISLGVLAVNTALAQSYDYVEIGDPSAGVDIDITLAFPVTSTSVKFYSTAAAAAFAIRLRYSGITIATFPAGGANSWAELFFAALIPFVAGYGGGTTVP